MSRPAAKSSSGDIAIVGMALAVPGARDVDAFWRNLAAGVESIEPQDEETLIAAGETPARLRQKNYVPVAAPLDGYADFDAEFFGFGPKEAAILDPQHRKFLEVSWQALEQAGHAPRSFGGRIAVYAGCGMGSYFYFNICSNPGLVDDVGMFLLRHTGNDKDFLSTRVSHVFDLKGPSVTMQTACSTSLVAIHHARAALMNGECDMALAGGVTIELPQGRGYLFKENEILSPDGHCHAFDHRAQGTVFGSGAGAVALRRLEDAVADGDHIWAVIRGSAINNDGAAKAGYLAPSVDGQAAAVTAALKDANVPADSIGYVECHGTGTYLGDPIEVAALTEAYRTQTQATDFCRIGSVKTNIGHLDTAAGVVSLIKTALSLHHAQIPPSLGFEAPNPTIDFETSPFRVNAALTDWPAGAAPRRAGVNSLGVGGTNAHVVLEQAPARAVSEEPDFPFHVLCLSGRSKAALDANAAALAAHLRAHPDQPLADVAWTLKEGREGFDKRRVLVAETHEDAAALLDSADPQRIFTHDRLGARPEVVFMFPGGGAQYPGMARDLYETEPVFAEWMDRGFAHLEPQLDYDIRALWLPEPGQEEAAANALRKPSVQLPLIMITEYALAQLWMSWGVRPAALVGHSMGENTAACLAGVMRFEDCIDLVLLRGRLFDSVPAGGMLSVSLPLAELEPLIGEDLDIASVNAPGLCAVSGSNAALEELAARLESAEIDHQRVAIDIAAHSRMLAPILGEFRAFLQGLDLRPPQIPFASNRSGAPITDAQAMDPEYWVQQLRNTVHFAQCIDTLATSDRVFLEVGPGKALSSLAQMSEALKPGQVMSTLRHPDHAIADDAYFLGVIGRLWACGLDADWGQIWGEARRNRVLLPGYQFQRSRYFIEPAAAAPAQEALARTEDMSDWGYRPVWRPALAPCEFEVASDLGPPLDWLIFADEAGVAQPVIDALRAGGHFMSVVRSGDSFRRRGPGDYVLSPEQGREGYEALLSALASEGRLPDRIAHFWLVTAQETYRPGSSFHDRNMEHGFLSLLHLAQAMGGAAMPDACHLSVIANGAVQVRDEPLNHPEKACALGPVGVIPREFPNVTAALLDIELPPAAPPRRLLRRAAAADDLAPRLLEDLLAEPTNDIAALRGARRFTQALRPAPLAATPDAAPLKQGGTYLVTGGLGGIGMAIARDLARGCAANIVLLSRSPLPERGDWDSVPSTSRAGARIAALRGIEDLGGQVMTLEADVTDIARMQEARAQILDRFGRLDGIFHAAGRIDDAPILAKDDAGVANVLAPKIGGLRVLDAVFPDGDVDLMVLFSSTSTWTRPAGQADYVAANAYLDAYAASRRGGATRVVAIDWGVWADTGMAAQAMAARMGDTTQPQEVDAPLLAGIRTDAGGAHRLTGALDAADDWVLAEHRTRGGQVLLPGAGVVELAAEALRAADGAGAFEISDLYFLRPFDVAPDAARAFELTLAPEGGGYRFEMRGAVTRDGREGSVATAEAHIRPITGGAPRVDLAQIEARCADTLPAPFASPQEAHLDFGPRWRVVERAAFGAGEGIARLALPGAAAGDIEAGFLAHPALLDLATGWAIALHGDYDADHLWVPAGYGAVRLHAPLPAEIASWVRLAPGSEGGTAVFDIVLTRPDGEVLCEIEAFQMRRVAADALGRAQQIAARDIRFDDAAEDVAPLSPGEARLLHHVSLGIGAEEGPEALRRALAGPLDRVAISSIALPALIEEAGRTDANPAEAAQSFERPDLDGDYVAPAPGLESALAETWSGLLGVGQVGAQDSFFDLGGHSLLAVRLFAQIRRDHGVQFPLSVLFEAPTIAALAARIAAETGCESDAASDALPATPDAPEQRHLVALHPDMSGGRTPFFVVAGMFGNVLNLRHLALLMGRERPVWGLQARGLIGEEAPHDTIEAAAADYIKEMRGVQPEGPYYIGGFSGGGITALEIAQQLTAAGEEVRMLAMLDTPLPVRPALTRRDKALIKMQELRRKGPGYLVEWARNRIAWEVTKRRGGQAIEETGGFNNVRIEQAFRTAVAAYEVTRWDGPLTLFRPRLDRHWKVSGGNWVSAEREYVFADNQWTRFASRTQVIEVPGDHDSMVLVPNVAVLARHLDALARAADAEARAGAPGWPGRTAAE
ncbi:SDR family NAD(P)-dependent oxidoreductase [Roseovarius spongiae]|uniref:SDR family NAD(P)-dependent oxidoreductase n=1 Tax=Roseovarius spongiae TaxID=2320272 RepID=A0A3A8BBS3_9RHOB|nr:type I polyketide synthase [Roseovarius spongiae]RKF16922.1 SDR family NAD(P)-dependent oxidoreductase [Roseovarius spongiae]